MFKTMPKGHVSCLAPAFNYTPATHTDLAKTFARIRRQLTPKAEPQPGDVPPPHQKKSGVTASRAIRPGWLKSARASKSVNRVTDITRLSGPHRPRSRVMAALAHSLLVFRRYRIAGERIWKKSRKTTSSSPNWRHTRAGE